MFSQEGNFLKGFGLAIVEQTADGEALPFAQFHFRIDLAHIDSRNLESRNLHGIGEVQRTDFGGDLEPDGSAWSNGWNEIEAHSILFELDADRCARAGARGALDHRIRILAAGQEAGLFAVLRQHIWL